MPILTLAPTALQIVRLVPLPQLATAQHVIVVTISMLVTVMFVLVLVLLISIWTQIHAEIVDRIAPPVLQLTSVTRVTAHII